MENLHGFTKRCLAGLCKCCVTTRGLHSVSPHHLNLCAVRQKNGHCFGYFWLLGAGVQAGATNPVIDTFNQLLFRCLSPCLITEIAYPTHPSILTALYNTAYDVGMWYFISTETTAKFFLTQAILRISDRCMDNLWHPQLRQFLGVATPVSASSLRPSGCLHWFGSRARKPSLACFERP